MTRSLKNKILVLENSHNRGEYSHLNENIIQDSLDKKYDLSSIFYRIKNRKDLLSMSKVISDTTPQSKVSTIVGLIDKSKLEDIVLSIMSCIDVCFNKKVLVISYSDIGDGFKDISINESILPLNNVNKKSLALKKLSDNISTLNYSYFLSQFVHHTSELASVMNQITFAFDKIIFMLDDKELKDLGVDARTPLLFSSHCDFIVRERKTRLSLIKKNTNYLKSLGVELGGIVYVKEGNK